MRVGHRGAAALAPESSLAAIEAAAACGPTRSSLDVPSPGLVVAHGPEVPLACAAARRGARCPPSRLGLAVQLDVKHPDLEPASPPRSGATPCSTGASSARTRCRSSPPSRRPTPPLPRALTYPEDRHGVTGTPRARPRGAARPGRAPRRCSRAACHAGSTRPGARAATLNWAVVTPAAIEACHRLGGRRLRLDGERPALARTLVEPVSTVSSPTIHGSFPRVVTPTT